MVCPKCKSKVQYFSHIENEIIQDRWFGCKNCDSHLEEEELIEDKKGWFITDDDCFQCCRIEDSESSIFTFVQINELPDEQYQISKSLIDLSLYNDQDEINEVLMSYGYDNFDKLLENTKGKEEANQLLAEMFFEIESYDYTEGDSLSWDESVEKVSEITGLSLNE